MPLSTAELQDPAKVELHESVKKALRSPMPGTTTLDTVIEKCVVNALKKIEEGFSDLDRATRRAPASRAPARPLPENSRLEKRVPPDVSGADDSTRSLIKSALAHGQVVSGARRNK